MIVSAKAKRISFQRTSPPPAVKQDARRDIGLPPAAHAPRPRSSLEFPTFNHLHAKLTNCFRYFNARWWHFFLKNFGIKYGADMDPQIDCEKNSIPYFVHLILWIAGHGCIAVAL